MLCPESKFLQILSIVMSKVSVEPCAGHCTQSAQKILRADILLASLVNKGLTQLKNVLKKKPHSHTGKNCAILQGRKKSGLTALFTVRFAHLNYIVIQCGCEAILG